MEAVGAKAVGAKVVEAKVVEAKAVVKEAETETRAAVVEGAVEVEVGAEAA